MEGLDADGLPDLGDDGQSAEVERVGIEQQAERHGRQAEREGM